MRKKSITHRQGGFSAMLQQIREDYRWKGDWTRPGFRAVAVYRFGVWASGWSSPWVRRPLGVIYWPLYKYIRNHYGIELPRTAKIGRRMLIAHQGGIVIHWRAEIGDDCIIRQNVTLGVGTPDEWEKAPVLRNRVELGAGAVIIGPVEIGDDVRIGPNVVVTTNIPPGSTVVVPPPRIVQFKRPDLPEGDNDEASSNHGRPAATS